jgi:Raf kinase inhibitor-like YbhB/YbcL family protein
MQPIPGHSDSIEFLTQQGTKMKMNKLIAALIFTGAVSMTSLSAQSQQAAQSASPQGSPKPPFSLISTGFDDGGILPEKFTAPTPTQFQNSPPFAWSNTPEGTASFVLLLHDVDGAVNKRTDDVTHWLIYNIPGSVSSLAEGVHPVVQLPDGSVQAPNQRKTPGYLGPGARGIYHHYVFELYALDVKLNLPTDAPRAEVFSALQGHVLGKAVLVARYKRTD